MRSGNRRSVNRQNISWHKLTAPIAAHLNTSYRHFFLFVTEVSRGTSRSIAGALFWLLQFDLVDKKELAPLDELNQAILIEDKIR
jgi:MOB kinase activator 1